MLKIKRIDRINWPAGTLGEHFSFSSFHPDGLFVFTFRYLNNRWNCWVTLPSKEERQAGVYPNVYSWTGFSDYGLVFSTALTVITKDALHLTDLEVVTWG